MSDDIDRNDEVLEMYAEDSRRDDNSDAGRHPDDDGSREPPPGDNGHPADDRIYPPPSAPYPVAQQLYRRHLSADGLAHLAAWRGGWMAWRTTAWTEVDVAQLRSSVYTALSQAVYPVTVRAPKGKNMIVELRPWNPTRYAIVNVLDALAAIVHLSSDIDPPSWVNGHATSAESPAAQMISCRNGLLDLSTRTLSEHTPALFNLVSVPLDYHDNADQPTEWLKFLQSVWDDDADSIALLQEYFGYVLSGRMDMQKMLMLHGPIRSGKGTIERVLAALMGGNRNIASPTLASLSTNFGLSPLVGKPLAFITDARLGNIPSHTVVERLLSITGEDWLTLDRKYREPWTGKLPTRFVIFTNELPKFRDSSGAIATRLLILKMTESFLGREDHKLFEKLLPELDGVLVWALEGLDRLTRNGHFTEPQSSRDSAALMMDMVSPASAFVRECCVRTPNAWVTRDDLYAAWKNWCENNGHQSGAKSTFGRDLRAVVPEVRSSQPRIGEKQVWCYTYIGLLPVSPVSGDKDAGQNFSGDTGSPVSEPESGQFAFDDTDSDTGSPVSGDGTKPQVNSRDTGDTGSTPNVGLGNSRIGAGPCLECRWYPTIQGHHPNCSANNNDPS